MQRSLATGHADLLPVSPRRGVVRLAPGFPIIVLIHGYVLVWLLGLQEFAWPVVGVLLGAWLVTRCRQIVVPRGFGLWLLFLGWTLASAFALADIDRAAAWGYREAMYVAATLVLLFFVNVSEHEMPTRRISLMLLSLWGLTVLGGFLGIMLPDTQITSVAEMLLPESVRQIGFVSAAVDPRLGSTAEFLGVPRPIMPYSYTNQWGAALGILTPLAMFARRDLRTRWARRTFWVVLASALTPAVVSVNRGLWVSIAVAAVLFMVRSGLRMRGGTVAAGVAVVTLGFVLVWMTPLRDVIVGRLDTPNIDTRETLAGAAVELTRQSPMIGFGAPVDEGTLADSNDVSVGTHGQLWTLLVSHGVPGALLFIGFFAYRVVASWGVSERASWAGIAVCVFLVQMPFYNALPVPLMLAMIAVALCVRDLRTRVGARDNLPTPATAVPNVPSGPDLGGKR
jgi:polysaccharide biosynthesis protein PslJ